MEVLALVPNALREASLALGVPRWRTTLSIVLPQTVGGIVTGTVLAIARVAGETAPLLLVSSVVGTSVSWDAHHALQTVPLAIYGYTQMPGGDAQALRLCAIAVVLSLGALVASEWMQRAARRRIAG